jgi:hypothetical protein
MDSARVANGWAHHLLSSFTLALSPSRVFSLSPSFHRSYICRWPSSVRKMVAGSDKCTVESERQWVALILYSSLSSFSAAMI